MTRAYNVALVLNPEQSDAEIERFTHSLPEFFKKLDGKITDEIVWGRRPTAYKLAGHSEGYYAFYTVELPPQSVQPLNNQLLLLPNVLRHLVTVVDHAESPVSHDNEADQE